ncbi:hypothetical protein C8R42DRAFT_690104 [Lentinula raphanica]|nr:hypothetical protein C8R42DRAFT_690104 [Lentinula raphanica]
MMTWQASVSRRYQRLFQAHTFLCLSMLEVCESFALPYFLVVHLFACPTCSFFRRTVA